MPATRSNMTNTPRRLPNGSLAVSTPTRVTTRVGAPIEPFLPTQAVSNQGATHSTDQTQGASQPSSGTGPVTMSTEDYLAIIAEQQRRIQTLVHRDLTRQMHQDTTYPIGRPSFAKGSDFRLPCTRVVLGLRHFPGDRGMINRRIWNEMQATTRAVISAATMYDKIATDAVWKRLGPDNKKYLKDQLVKVISKTQMHREVIFLNGDVERNKFYQHWPLERTIMSALSTDR
ncbi:hypothetical protein QFC20_006626 [Naganishia adeliensis]|uniref:Uncharacterized protein n=1 Tax=Naganishia adeliensis TaxID=92952 RepID=A0ACC2V9C7_9TREE|nr:hypothetical protein QFC20_006626 [Naganishia adeliensis]